ncbi:MAG TPA: hypothetical protein ENN68_05325 [Methanomicrobia archaeon]|nr:hypothetical protein [Methanomicrobia archaeon]
MGELIAKALKDIRIVAVLPGLALVWRMLVSLDQTEVLWESICSGLSLFLLGWICFSYTHAQSRQPTRWPVSTTLYQRISLVLLVLNGYLLIYYGLRWAGLLHKEAYPPLDFIVRDARYVTFVVAYSAILWSTKYLKQMQEGYRFLVSPSGLLDQGIRERIFKAITDDRTLVVLIGLAFLWRTVISFDYTLTIGESMASGIALLIIGWFLIGYLCALAVKTRNRIALSRLVQGLAVALGTLNIYALMYYSMTWYRLVKTDGFREALAPLDSLFGDLGFFSLVLFYFTAMMVAKSLEKASADYIVPLGTRTAG